MQIRNFTLAELTYSQVAVDNKIFNLPSFEAIENLRLLVENVLEPLRLLLKKPINISSGFRNIQVNSLVGGVLNSQHMLGQACDLWISGMLSINLFNFVINSGLIFDQCLLENDRVADKSWLHLSYNKDLNRGQKFIVEITKDKTTYTEV